MALTFSVPEGALAQVALLKRESDKRKNKGMHSVSIIDLTLSPLPLFLSLQMAAGKRNPLEKQGQGEEISQTSRRRGEGKRRRP